MNAGDRFVVPAVFAAGIAVASPLSDDAVCARSGAGLWAVAAATGLASLVILTGAQGAPTGGWDASNVRSACAGSNDKLRCYHRQVRRRLALPLLRDSRLLDRAAHLKARRIRRCHRVAHAPCGEPFERPFRLAGYLPWHGAWIVGENLAWGWPTPWEAFQALMRSHSHRANILRRSFREIGVRQARSPWGRLWVVVYGHRW